MLSSAQEKIATRRAKGHDQGMAARQEKTRQALVAAATRLFATHGLRRTAMEAIALEAQVAKATAYAYFANKEAVFVAVVDAVIAQMETASAAAAASAPNPVEAVCASMVAKFSIEWRLVHAAEHAAELLAASDGLAGAAMKAAHERHAKRLAALLVKAGVPRGEALELAETLDDAFEGVTAGAASIEQLASRGQRLVERLLS